MENQERTSLKSFRLRKLLDPSYFVLVCLFFCLSLPGPSLALLSLTGPNWAKLGLTGPYLALLTGPYWPLPGLNEPYFEFVH